MNDRHLIPITDVPLFEDMEGDGVVRVAEILRAIGEILEDRLQQRLGNPPPGVLLTIDFVRELIALSEVDLNSTERAALERVCGTKIF